MAAHDDPISVGSRGHILTRYLDLAKFQGSIDCSLVRVRYPIRLCSTRTSTSLSDSSFKYICNMKFIGPLSCFFHLFIIYL